MARVNGTTVIVTVRAVGVELQPLRTDLQILAVVLTDDREAPLYYPHFVNLLKFNNLILESVLKNASTKMWHT